MAETSSSAEGRRAARGSPSDTTSPPAKEQTSPQHSTKTAQATSAAGSGPAARPGGTVVTRYFTLYARPASTKKQGLRLAFGARAGRSTVRNRAKRQAREAYRLNRQKLPEAREIVITTRGSIDSLRRQALRDQLAELFGRATASFPPLRGARPTTTR
jgi:ribonuclease P protein component